METFESEKAAPPRSGKSLLDELGGRDAIELVVAAFYDRVLADTRLAPHFRGVQMSRMQNLQVDYLCALAGGSPYQGRELGAVHAGMGLGDEHFDAVGGHLAAAMALMEVPPALADRLARLIAPLRPLIVRQPC